MLLRDVVIAAHVRRVALAVLHERLHAAGMLVPGEPVVEPVVGLVVRVRGRCGERERSGNEECLHGDFLSKAGGFIGLSCASGSSISVASRGSAARCCSGLSLAYNAFAACAMSSTAVSRLRRASTLRSMRSSRLTLAALAALCRWRSRTTSLASPRTVSA